MKTYFSLPCLNENFLSKEEHVFLFETVRCDRENFKSYLFSQPKEIICVEKEQDVPSAFEKIESFSKKAFLAGFLSYELGYFFNDLPFAGRTPFPLLYFGVFDKAL
ncbi:MAG: hypothetical protein JW928_05630, partial [Candidatus Aureabacteria bacterium]|nr:hypothetical protein [Candidatus Auribacterota bacterium]